MLALDSMPLRSFRSFVKRWAFVVAVASWSFASIVDDSCCSSHFDPSPAIVDDVVAMLTTMESLVLMELMESMESMESRSSVTMDLRQHCVAFVVSMDGMTMHNPCSMFALRNRAQQMVASPFVQVLVMLIRIQFVGLPPHFLMIAVAIAVAVDLVHCQANDHAVTMDYSIRFVVASVLPVT